MGTIERLEMALEWADAAMRHPEEVKFIVVHRIEVSQEDPSFSDTPADIARFFHEHPIGIGATAGKMPYPIVITPEGSVVQTLPLGVVTPHVRSHNPHAIGVAAVGDFRQNEPTPAQRDRLIEVCASLLWVLNLQAEDALRGHDELAGGSVDPDKVCPGPGLGMDFLRRDVAVRLAAWRAEVGPVAAQLPPYSFAFKTFATDSA